MLKNQEFPFVSLLNVKFQIFSPATGFLSGKNHIGYIAFGKNCVFSAQIFFGGLNQKSAMISMCKIHIYIDSESFRQIH